MKEQIRLSWLPELVKKLSLTIKVDEAADTTTIENVGAVTSQGVKAMKADEARKTFGVDGSGIKIGVISDSYDRDLTASTRASDGVASGDLPGVGNPNGYTTPVKVLDDSADNSSSGLIDEGRGMMEIVHDVAPGAELLFHTGFKNPEDFAQGINELTAAGADIIVDDIFYGGEEPFFQDGVIAQAIDKAVNNGVAYFTAAGNRGRNSYESEFRGVEPGENVPIAGIERDRYLFHDFNSDAAVDLLQGITLAPGENTTLSLNWDEPFASAGGKGSGSDLDVFVLDSQNNLISTSTESNVGNNAVEVVNLSNTTQQNEQYNLLIGFDRSAGGTPPSQLKYIFFGAGSEIEYATNSPTIFGHYNSDRGVAVGATDYRKTPAFGTDPAQIESFSSLGGTPILFTPNGDRLGSPEIRQNPEIVTPNNANTTFFFAGEDPEQDGFPNFSGTSAAAPHAAGVAALMLDAAPGKSPDEIYQALEQTALDMDDPATPGFDRGFDFATGNGLIQADRAIESILGGANETATVA
jgi:hypothetical protein